MQATISTGGPVEPADRGVVEQYYARGEFFWLDLDGVDDEARALLLEVLHLHHLAVDGARRFGQRPKAEDYGDFVYLVVHGAGTGTTDSTAEVHFVVAEHFVVTVHRGDCPALEPVRERIGHRRPSELESPQIALLYLVINELVDGFFPLLDSFDNRIDELEDAILVRPTEEQLGALFAMKRTLIGLRKVITPERDMFASLTAGVIELPGVGESGQRYLRDLYDHLIRISDLVDGYRDLLSSVMDTHLSTVSNRLNVVMKQLTIIATVFLPLSFLTGFFGQNFSWLVSRITGWWAFATLGLGLELVSAGVLLYVFRRRGWLGGPSA